jgi:hypothetical protein
MVSVATEHHSADAGTLRTDATKALHSKHAGHGKAVTHVHTLARLKPATHHASKKKVTRK